MKIKVCGMRDPDNIAKVACLKPDFMGFIFYEKSPRYAEQLRPDALNVLSGKTLRVGVFVDAEEDYIRKTTEKYQLDFLQLHGNESPETCFRLKKYARIIKAFGLKTTDDLKPITGYEGICDYYVFDTKTKIPGGSGQQFDHQILSAYEGKTPYLLSGGLSPEDKFLVANAKKLCAGFDINSRFETAPGVKDIDLIKQFIEFI